MTPHGGSSSLHSEFALPGIQEVSQTLAGLHHLALRTMLEVLPRLYPKLPIAPRQLGSQGVRNPFLHAPSMTLECRQDTLLVSATHSLGQLTSSALSCARKLRLAFLACQQIASESPLVGASPHSSQLSSPVVIAHKGSQGDL